jgi:hypothetical protein
MHDMPTRYRVLDEGVTRASFGEAATGLGLSQANVFEPDGDSGYEEVWANEARTGALNYIEDPVTGEKYIAASGSDADDLIAGLTRKIHLYSPDELVEEAYSSEAGHNDRVANLFRLALTFPEHDKDVYAIFENYVTKAPHPKLRTAALDAIGLHAWTELRPIVEKVAREDQDPEVREYATAVLERWTAAQGA